jgi:integrase
MSSIRKRGKKYQVQVRRKGTLPISRTFHSKQDALEWSRHMESSADRRELAPAYKELANITLAEIMIKYRDEISITKLGYDNERHYINRFIKTKFSQQHLISLKPSVFSLFIDEQLKKYKPETVCREIAIIQHALETAIRKWNLPLRENPLRKVDKPRVNNIIRKRYSKDQYDDIIRAVSLCLNIYAVPLIEFALETAMRRSEILRAEWDDVDFKKSTLEIPRAKNGFPRVIPLSPKAIAIITSLKEINKVTHKPEKIIFPLSINSVRCITRTVHKSSSAKNFRFHDLRHEAITRYFEAGLSVPEVSIISGHRDYNMLQRYTQITAEDVLKKLK